MADIQDREIRAGRGRLFAWATVAVAAVVAVATVLWIRRHPLAYHAWQTRRALSAAGLERAEIRVGGGRLTYWRGGQGTDLVLLHGAGDQAGAWSAVVRRLQARHRLLVPDLPGHGDSAPASGPLPLGRVLDGVSELLTRETGREPFILVGNSLGAWLAVLYAHDHPGRVARVVAVNGGPLRGETQGLTLAPADRDEARRLVAALRDPASPPIPDFVLDDIVRQARDGPIGRLMQEAEAMEEFLLDGRLHQLDVPVDLVWGESDHLLGLDYARALLTQLPRARLTLVPDCGHVPMNECPKRFGEILERTLASPPPAGPGRSASARVDP